MNDFVINFFTAVAIGFTAMFVIAVIGLFIMAFIVHRHHDHTVKKFKDTAKKINKEWTEFKKD